MFKFIFLLFISLNAFADSPRVVLLSSLTTPEVWYHSKDWKIEKPLKEIFTNGFKKTKYEIVIKERAGAKELREELLNPNNIAVFWVSHAAGLSSSTVSNLNSSAIVDYQLHNVEELFKDIHPNLRFLGLVGCRAMSIIKNFKKEGHYKKNPLLTIHSFETKEDARVGLRKSIKESATKLGELATGKRRMGKRRRTYKKAQIINEKKFIQEFNKTKNCNIKQTGIELTVKRVTNEDSPFALLTIDNYVIGTFNSLKAHETDEKTLYVTEEQLNKLDTHNIQVSSLKIYSKDRINLGRFTFNSNQIDGNWGIIKRRNGTAIGATHNRYRYSGETPKEFINYYPYSTLPCFK